MKKIGAIVLLAATLAFAQAARFGAAGRGFGGRMAFAGQGAGAGAHALRSVDNVKAYLGLTDAQVTQLQQLRTDEFTANQSLREQVVEKEKSLRTAMAATNPTAAELGAILLDIKNLRTQFADNRSKYQTQAVALLTDDQKTKLSALQAAAALRPTIGEATMLNLLTPPEPPAGLGFGPGGPAAGGPPRD